MFFLIKEDHIKLLKSMYVTTIEGEGCIFSPSIDPKRPYGNSDILEDIIKILKLKGKDREEKAEKLHEEMQYVLQISMVFCDSGIKVGRYKLKDDYDFRSWVRA